jgi:putative ABC transport system substrate-binding protein
MLGLSFLTVPLRALGQPQKVLRIGVLSGAKRPASLESTSFAEFLQGMRGLGYVEGKDLVVEWRFADGSYERFAGFAQEFVRMPVDVIVALNTRAAIEAKRATSTIPIVFAAISDPVGSGLVASLARPGGNVTGSSQASDMVIAKQLELSKAVIPSLARVTALINPDNPINDPLSKALRSAAEGVGVTVTLASARNLEELGAAFASINQDRAEAVIVFDDSVFINNRFQIGALAIRYRLPSIAGHSDYANGGLLMSYGERIGDQFRRAAAYVDKIFKGAKPADLPVEQPTRFHLTINLKTAKALGLTVPQSVLARADEVIH